MQKPNPLPLMALGVLLLAVACLEHTLGPVSSNSTVQGRTRAPVSVTPVPTVFPSIEPGISKQVIATPSPIVLPPHLTKLGAGDQWKTFDQLKVDLETVVNAGYRKVCLFDLDSIWGYPDARYIPLLKKYADNGIDLTIYAQDLGSDQATLTVFQSMGASAVLVYDRNLLMLFRRAGIKTIWWSMIGYPYAHKDQPQYKDWLDLRSDLVRKDIANWAVQIPSDVDGGLSLDYIRWNKVGDDRTAEQVSDLVHKIRTQWTATGKGALSAAVYPYLGASPSYGGALSVGQKWNEWLKDNLVDFVYPMAYTSEDIPWLIGEWNSYDKSRIIPCLSVVKYK